MQSDRELREQLRNIDHKSYPQYKSLKGSYRFPKYILHIDHVPVSYTHLDVYKRQILTNPGNPSGHLLSQEFLTKVAGLCRHMNIRLLIDECFIELTGEGKDKDVYKRQDKDSASCLPGRSVRNQRY